MLPRHGAGSVTVLLRIADDSTPTTTGLSAEITDHVSGLSPEVSKPQGDNAITKPIGVCSLPFSSLAESLSDG